MFLILAVSLGWIMVPPARGETVAHKKSLKKMTRKKNVVDIRLLENRISALEKEANQLSQTRLNIVRQLDDVNQSINQRRLRVSLVSQENNEITREIKRLEKKQKAVINTIDQNRSIVGERLCALHRIRGTGSWSLFSKPRSLFDFWKRQQTLTVILASDVDLVKKQAADLKKLEQTTLLLEGEIREKQRLDSRLNLEIKALENQKAKRQALLAEVKGKRALTKAAMVSARKALVKTMQSLKKSSLSSDDISEKKSPARKWKAEKGLFLSRRGRLPMPVDGHILSKFGTRIDEDDKTFTFQTGVDIRVDMGEPVKSVFRGEILYADWLKGYGNLIIINHGDNYYTLYAHVEELFKQKGDVVEDREVIATAGDTGTVRGPYLHFEVRHHDKPMDPLKWLKKGA
ncbi:murein hydrolase activator EnvC family protein [Desulfocicer vacuolatum]|nr:M23 family metallopeptidase [Desulfocicer vacuolatum]